MNNIEENIANTENLITEPKNTQGLSQENRNLRARRNVVNYQILDNGDSSYYAEDFSEEYEEIPEDGRKKSKAKQNRPVKSIIKEEEPENLVDDIETIQDDEEEDLSNVINISELKGTEIKNSKLILALIEVCINSKKYEIKLANKSRIFWDEVYQKPDFEDIFKAFKGETLRKYWRTISDIGKMSKVIKTVRKYHQLIDDPNAKYCYFI
jgi:hypothetical protein